MKVTPRSDAPAGSGGTPTTGAAAANMTTALEKKKPWSAMSPKERKGTLHEKLVLMRPTLKSLVPAGWDADRMIRLAIIATTNNPDLLNCTPVSFFRAVAISASLGLDPTGVLGAAYLVPFSKEGVKEVQFIAGYRGLIDLARRSGNISTITADVVREGDEFDYSLGTNPFIKHRPHDWEGDKAPKLTHVYAVAKLTGAGDVQFVVLTAREVEKVRAASKSAKSAYSPWTAWTEEMWKKTAVKRLTKLLPMSTELATAVVADDRGEMAESNEDLVAASLQIPEDIMDDLREKEQTTGERIKERVKAQDGGGEREPGEEG